MCVLGNVLYVSHHFEAGDEDVVNVFLKFGEKNRGCSVSSLRRQQMMITGCTEVTSRHMHFPNHPAALGSKEPALVRQQKG